MRRLSLVTVLIFLAAPLFFNSRSFGYENSEKADLFVLKRNFASGLYDITRENISGFFLKYPQTRYGDQLHLILGKCHYLKGRIRYALYEFGIVAEDSSSELQDAALYWTAEVYFASQDYKEALEYYEKVIDGFPSSRFFKFALYSKGWAYYMLGYPEEASGAFGEVTRAFPDDKLAMGSQFKIGECMIMLKRYDKALASFREYAERFPVSERAPEAIFMAGEAAFDSGDFKGAADHIKKALSLSSGNAAWKELALYRLACAYFELGEYANSLKEFSGVCSSSEAALKASAIAGKAKSLVELGRLDEALQACVVMPEDDRSYYVRCEIALKKGDHSLAAELCKEVLDKFPESGLRGELCYVLGLAYSESGKPSEGIRELMRAADSPSKDLRAKALCAVGDIYMKEGRYGEALAAFDKALSFSAGKDLSARAQHKLGSSLMALARYEEAALAFQSAIVNFPDSAVNEDASYMLALANFKKGDLQSAVSGFERYLKEYPSGRYCTFAAFYLGNALYSLNRFTDAIPAYRKVLDDGKVSEDILALARYESGWCWYNLMNNKKALGDFSYIVKSYPNSPIALDTEYWFGEYAYSKNSLGEARKHFAKVLKESRDPDLSSRAQFYLALIFEKERNYEAAAKGFMKVADDYRGCDLVPDSLLRAGDALVKMARYGEAVTAYETLASGFPGTVSANAALQKKEAILRQLGLMKDEDSERTASGHLLGDSHAISQKVSRE